MACLSEGSPRGQLTASSALKPPFYWPFEATWRCHTRQACSNHAIHHASFMQVMEGGNNSCPKVGRCGALPPYRWKLHLNAICTEENAL